MRPEERDAAYLWDIREHGSEAMALVEGLDYAGYLANRQVTLAVERLLEIVGEAARRVSPALKAAHPEIPWGDMIGQRNVLAHEYGTIKQELLWVVLTQNLPGLILQLDTLIPSPPDDEG